MSSVDIFESVLPEDQQHESFKGIQKSPAHKGCRRLMNEIFNSLPKPDNNFVEQFQSQGFDARVFELGVFAVLVENGLNVTQPHDRPDYFVDDGTEEAWVEVTTSNPPSELQLTNINTQYKDLDQDILYKKIVNEVPIRLGSPLFSKLNKKYWELPQCQGKPLVLAIQAFHEPMASQFTATPLICYLYGTMTFPTWTEEGKVILKEKSIGQHKHGKKTIPSNFYGQPETSNITAVLFSNQLTISKFTRMAYQKGYQKDELTIVRSGVAYDMSSGTMVPKVFKYKLGEKGAHAETWSEGVSLMVNPIAEEPISPWFFPMVSTHMQMDGEVISDVRGFHPLNNQSIVICTKKD